MCRASRFMLGSWTTANKVDVASKLKKYRARITFGRNHQHHGAITEQVRKYGKWKPGTCYEKLVRAECSIANGDLDGAQETLEEGIALKEGGVDAVEALMWRGVLSYIAGDSKSSLRFETGPACGGISCCVDISAMLRWP